MPDPKEKLYKNLSEKGLYTKSYDDFKTQFSTDDKIRGLYDGLNKKGLYTKSQDDFVAQFFSDIKKKDQTDSGVGGQEFSPDGQPIVKTGLGLGLETAKPIIENRPQNLNITTEQPKTQQEILEQSAFETPEQYQQALFQKEQVKKQNEANQIIQAKLDPVSYLDNQYEKIKAEAQQSGYDDIEKYYQNQDKVIAGSFLNQNDYTEYEKLNNVNTIREKLDNYDQWAMSNYGFIAKNNVELYQKTKDAEKKRLEKELNQYVLDYQNYVNSQQKELDDIISKKQLDLQNGFEEFQTGMGVNKEQITPERREEILSEIDNLKRSRSKFFLSPEEQKTRATEEIETKEAPTSVLQEEMAGLSAKDRFDVWMRALDKEYRDLAKELDFDPANYDGGIGDFIQMKMSAITGLSPKEERLAELHQMLNTYAPIYLLNKNPIKASTSGFGESFKQAYVSGQAPLGKGLVQTSEQEAQNVIEAMSTLGIQQGDLQDTVNKNLNIQQTEKGLGDAGYWGQTLGTTSSIMMDFAQTAPITEVSIAKAVPILSRLSQSGYSSGAAYLRLLGRKSAVGKFFANPKTVDLFGQTLSVGAKGLTRGLQYEITGQIFKNSQDEANFASGLMGSMGEQFISGFIPPAKLFAPALVKVFGEKSGQVLTRIMQRGGTVLSRGTAETAEEFAQELTQIYQTTRNSEEFFGELEKRFGGMDDVVKFAATTFIMGSLFSATDLGNGSNNLNRSTVESMNPDQKVQYKKIQDEIVKEIESSTKEVPQEVVNEVNQDLGTELKPNDLANEEVLTEVENAIQEADAIKTQVEETKQGDKKAEVKEEVIATETTQPEIATPIVQEKEQALEEETASLPAIDIKTPEQAQTAIQNLEALKQSDPENAEDYDTLISNIKTKFPEQKGIQGDIIETPETQQNIVEAKPVKNVKFKKNAVEGEETSVILANNERKQAKFAVVEADDLITSHDPMNFQENKDFPAKNDRDYSIESNQINVLNTANNYDTRGINDAEGTAEGSIVVTPDGVVVSGNERTMAYKIANQNKTGALKADETGTTEYKKALIAKAKRYGLDAEQISKMKNPVFVRVLQEEGEVTTSEMAKYNPKAVGKMKSPTEVVTGLKGEVGGNTRKAIGQVISEYEAETLSDLFNNPRAVKKLSTILQQAGIVSDKEMGAYFAGRGTVLTESGKDLVQNILASGVLSEENIKRSDVSGVKSMVNKVASVNVQLSELGESAKPLVDLLNDAISLEAETRLGGFSSVSDFQAQESLFGEKKKFSGEAVAMNSILKNASAKELKQIINGFKEIVTQNKKVEEAKSDLFGGTDLTKTDENKFLTDAILALTDAINGTKPSVKSGTKSTIKGDKTKGVKGTDKGGSEIARKSILVQEDRNLSLKTKEGKVVFDSMITRIKRAFPNLRIVADKAEWNAIVQQFKLGGKLVDGEPVGIDISENNAVIYEGVVYINPDKVTMDTPVHEAGHIFIELLKRRNPSLYAKGKALIDNTLLLGIIAEKYGFNLDDPAQREAAIDEALVYLIGLEGAKQFDQKYSPNSSFANKFKAFISDMWTYFTRMLGISPKIDLKNMTLDEFATINAREILLGTPITRISREQYERLFEDPKSFKGSKMEEEALLLGEKGIIKARTNLLKGSHILEKAFVSDKKSFNLWDWIEKEYRMKEVTEKLGALQTATNDFYTSTKLQAGKVVEKQKKAFQAVLDIYKTLKSKGFSAEDFQKYLIAKHAVERNKAIEFLRKSEYLQYIKASLKYNNRVIAKLAGIFPAEIVQKYATSMAEIGRELHQIANDNLLSEMADEKFKQKKLFEKEGFVLLSAWSDFTSAIESVISELEKAGYDTEIDKAYFEALKRTNKDLEQLARNQHPEVYLTASGSGMSNAEAESILSIEGDKKAVFEEMAQKFRNDVILQNMKEMLDSGLISKEEYDKILGNFEFYVPLKVKKEKIDVSEQSIRAEHAERKRIGDVLIEQLRGTRNWGWQDRYDPITAALSDFERNTMLGEANKTRQKFLQFVQDNPDKRFYEIVETKSKLSQDREANLVLDEEQKAGGEYTLPVFVDGKRVKIAIRDSRLKEAFDKGTLRGIAQFFSVLGGKIRTLNSFFRNFLITYNPGYLVPAVMRDLGTALINIGAEEDVSGVEKDMLKDFRSAYRAIYGQKRGKEPSKSVKALRESYDLMREYGGEMSWLTNVDYDEQLKKMQKEIDRVYGRKEWYKKAYDMLADVNQFILDVESGLEGAVRLAAFHNVLKRRIAKIEADKQLSEEEKAQEIEKAKEDTALMAKNLTVNFEQKGALGTFMDTFYLFFNANVQGTVQLLRNAEKSQRVRKRLLAITVSAILMRALNDWMAEDDDELQQAIKAVPDWDRDRNLIYILNDGTQLRIPLPYGYNTFATLGDVMYDIGTGKTDALNGTMRYFYSLNGAFNPLSQGNPISAIIPSILRPAYDALALGENYLGNDLKRESTFGKNKPAPERQSIKDSPLAIWVAREISDLTGGERGIDDRIATKGILDFTPAQYEEMAKGYLGGFGNFIRQIYKASEDVSNGEFNPDNMPLVNAFVRANWEVKSAKRILREFWKNSMQKRMSDEDMKLAEWAYKTYEKSTESREEAKKAKEMMDDIRIAREYIDYQTGRKDVSDLSGKAKKMIRKERIKENKTKNPE